MARVAYDTMKFLLLIIPLTIALASCGDISQKTIANSGNKPSDTVYLKDTTIKFEYRDILEDHIDSLRPKEIKGLFGTWTITSIAIADGRSQSEELIQAQIGHELYFDSSSLTFDFLNRSIKIDNPVYSIKYFMDNKSLKGTSLFNGYRPCRKSATMLDISERLYIEVIHFQEMAYFYEGRIYFITRKK